MIHFRVNIYNRNNFFPANCQLFYLPSELRTQHSLSSLKHKNLKSTILFRYAHKVFNINGPKNSFSCLPTANR